MGQHEGRALGVLDLTGLDDLATNMYWSPKTYYSPQRESDDPEHDELTRMVSLLSTDGKALPTYWLL